MSYRVGLEIFETSDMSSTRVFRSMECDQNTILTQCVAGLVVHNPSSFTGLVMKIYSDSNGSPGVLIATSTNSWSKATLLTTSDNYGVKWPYFNFSNINLRQGLTYHFVINGATGYTADPSSSGGNSYFGWRIGYPDGVYEDLNYVDQIKWYFDLSFLGKRL